MKGGRKTQRRRRTVKKQRGGALNNHDFATLLDLVLRLVKSDDNNPGQNDNNVLNLLNQCSKEQLSLVLSNIIHFRTESSIKDTLVELIRTNLKNIQK